MTNCFFLRPTNGSEIYKAIRDLKNKASSVNLHSTIAMKRISNIVSPILVELINVSLATGNFPHFLKIYRVIPLYKAGDNANVNKYRPISVVPILSKIFDFFFFEQFILLLFRQMGFCKQLSTSHVGNYILHAIYDISGRGHTAAGIFLDFCKAFDCINHRIVLDKMYTYGVRAMASKWFESYLSNTRQYVSVHK